MDEVKTLVHEKKFRKENIMPETTTKKTIYTKLLEAQKKFKPAIKDASNPFYKSSYADLTGVWDACKDALHSNGLFVSQQMTANDTLITRIYDETGNSIDSEIRVQQKEANNMQSFGSGITYARRYALASLLGIVTEDDDGNASTGIVAPKKVEEPAVSNKITMPQMGKIRAMYADKQLDTEAMKLVLKSRYGIEKHNDLTVSEASDYISYLITLPAKDTLSDIDGKLPEF